MESYVKQTEERVLSKLSSQKDGFIENEDELAFACGLIFIFITDKLESLPDKSAKRANFVKNNDMKTVLEKTKRIIRNKATKMGELAPQKVQTLAASIMGWQLDDDSITLNRELLLDVGTMSLNWWKDLK